MEKSGLVTAKRGRVSLFKIILPSFILFLLIAGCYQWSTEKKAHTMGSVKGIIQYKDGRPVEDAVIIVKEGTGTFHDIASVSDGLGGFYVSGIVIPGRYVLQVQHNNGSFIKEVDIQSDSMVIRISL